MQRRLTDGERYVINVCVENAKLLEQNGIKIGRELAEQMLTHNTTDGRPYVDPPLTDEDARARPWVMCRDQDDCDWQGPLVLIGKLPTGMFVSRTSAQASVHVWRRCRRATPAEIAAAGLEVTE